MTESLVSDVPATVPTVRRRRSAGRQTLTIVGLAWIAVVIVGALTVQWLSPHGPNDQDLQKVFGAPSSAHWLGTDELGRDILVRLLYGARPTLVAVGLAILVYVVWGGALGLVAGYLAGWADRVIGVVMSVLLATPHVVILFVFLSIYRGNVYLAMLIFGFLTSPVMVLIVRGS